MKGKNSSCKVSHSANVLNLAPVQHVVPTAAAGDHKNAKRPQPRWWRTSVLSGSITNRARRRCDVSRLQQLTVSLLMGSTSIMPRRRFWQSGGMKWGMWKTPSFTFSSRFLRLSSSKGRAPWEKAQWQRLNIYTFQSLIFCYTSCCSGGYFLITWS